MIRSVSFVTHSRTRFKIPIFRETFEEIYDMCSFQDSRSSTMRPKYLDLFTRLISAPSTRTAINLWYYVILVCSNYHKFRLKCIQTKFINYFFSQSHIFTMSGINLYSTSKTDCCRCTSIICIHCNISIFNTIRQIVHKHFENNGPKIDPCGTPDLTFLQLDVQLFTLQHCCLSVKYELNFRCF